MKINRTPTFRYFLSLVCFVGFTQWQGIHVAMSQEFVEPISRAHLVSTIKLNRNQRNPLDKITMAGIIRRINRYGVDFQLTAEAEQEIRRAGDYFGKNELDKLVSALRSNYRPEEPTEAEMLEALLNTLESRGAQRTAEPGIEVSNVIAGMRINFANFEKLRCTPPTYGPGYYCTYNFSLPITFFSNDPSAQGHMGAMNLLLRFLMNGNTITERQTNRFVWSKNRWIVSVE